VIRFIRARVVNESVAGNHGKAESRKAMKSFRFYWRAWPPEGAPAKRRTDYSAGELAAFRDEFDRRWKRRKRRAWPLLIAFGVWVGGRLAVLGFVPREVEWELGLMLVFLAMIACIAVFLPFPRCPACASEIDEYVRNYCPNCGRESVSPARLLKAQECLACGSVLRVGKGRDYKVRFCTTCGVEISGTGV
jgi:predicted RNA-binding Zn-ribbon protein involved in translation (DUF1610 family)